MNGESAGSVAFDRTRVDSDELDANRSEILGRLGCQRYVVPEEVCGRLPARRVSRAEQDAENPVEQPVEVADSDLAVGIRDAYHATSPVERREVDPVGAGAPGKEMSRGIDVRPGVGAEREDGQVVAAAARDLVDGPKFDRRVAGESGHAGADGGTDVVDTRHGSRTRAILRRQGLKPIGGAADVVLLYAPVFVPAFLIVLLEMTEVVALVFALTAGGESLRPAVYGAAIGTAVVGGIALGAAAALEALPRDLLLGPSAVVLAGFGVFLFRSTLRAYRRGQSSRPAPGGTEATETRVQFAGGFSVGLVETTEAVIVLLALAAPGYGSTALLGAVTAGAALVGAAWLLHGQIRRIKIPVLKAGATALLFTFAVFWGGEALGFRWPLEDLFLLPLFVGATLAVRGAVAVVHGRLLPVDTKS